MHRLRRRSRCQPRISNEIKECGRLVSHIPRFVWRPQVLFRSAKASVLVHRRCFFGGHKPCGWIHRGNSLLDDERSHILKGTQSGTVLVEDFQLSLWRGKQVVRLSENVVSWMKSPEGLILAQWKIDEIVDLAFFHAAREVGGKKLDDPIGQIRIAKTWEERRRGLYAFNWVRPFGIYFDMRHEQAAFELYKILKEHPKLNLKTPPHEAQVETDRFVLTLTKAHLTITHRPYFWGFKQAVDSRLTHPELDAEISLPLTSIQGHKLRQAVDDKIRGGRLPGRLAIYTSSQGLISSYVGRTSNELELDFGRRHEDKVHEFVRKLEIDLSQLPNGHSQGDENKASLSVADELQKLASLHTSGALSDSEFATAKSKLLGA
jgi:hypothetical protein